MVAAPLAPRTIPTIRTINVTRYVTPLREGGSLPAIVEADDDGLYVLKFRGAGQGPKALIAELVAGEIARALGLQVPEIVLVNLDAALSRTEPDPEIQELLAASAGLNLALDYLPGSITFDPLVATNNGEPIGAMLASRIVCFDSFVTNVDRTPRNANLLVWHKNIWLIDHGASLYFQHSWTGWEEKSRSPFPQIKDHVLLGFAAHLDEAEAELHARLEAEILHSILALIPDEWLLSETRIASADEGRSVYGAFLTERLQASSIFTQEAIHARKARL
jgi:hypothetical protein